MGFSSLTKDETQAPCIGSVESQHWTTREVPRLPILSVAFSTNPLYPNCEERLASLSWGFLFCFVLFLKYRCSGGPPRLSEWGDPECTLHKCRRYARFPSVILMSRQVWGPLILESSTGFPFPNFLRSQNFLPSQNCLLINQAHHSHMVVFTQNIKEYLQFLCCCAAAKSLQSCPTLCYPVDGSPPGSPVPGILQARTLEWVAISFSNVWKWKVKGKSLSHVRLLATPWTAAYQAPPSMGFSRQEYWSGVPLPSPTVFLEDLKDETFFSMVNSFCSCFYDLRSDSRGWNTRRQWSSRNLSYGFPNDHSGHSEDAFFYFMTPAAVMKFTNSCNGVEVFQVWS